MPVFDDEQDEIAFLERNPERGIAIVLPKVIENHLTSILKAAMRPNTAISNDLFSPRGAFGNFGTKIRLSYMLELIDDALYKDLIIINKIRNEFAHKIIIKNFDQPPINAWIKDMHVYSTLIALRNNRSKEPDDRSVHVLRFILRDELESSRDTFKTCIRVLIHHLTQLEKSVSEVRKSRTSSS
jgi:DNA-binding MltR family transcriptional regulator